MKKILSISAVLLTAVLLLSGCSNASSGDGSGDSLPGRWKKTTDSFFKTYSIGNGNFWGVVTADGKGSVTYKTEKSGYNVFSEDNPAPAQGRITYFSPNFAPDLTFTGFEATASSTSAYCVYGFTFNVDSTNDNKYVLFIQNSSFQLIEQDGNTINTLQKWTSDSCIKGEPNENKVTVYKDGNSIIIMINGKTIHTISNPKYTMGRVGFLCSISNDDYIARRAFTVNYKIEQLQY